MACLIRKLSILILVSAFASPAWADDPLEDVSGTEDWLRVPPAQRRPAETRRQLRARMEFEETAEEFEADRLWLQHEQQEFAGDRAALAAHLPAARATRGAEPRNAKANSTAVADQAFEETAHSPASKSAEAAFDSAGDRSPPTSSTTRAAVADSPRPSDKANGTQAPTRADELAREGPAAREEQRLRQEEARLAAERADAEQQRNSREDAERAERLRREEEARLLAARQAEAERLWNAQQEAEKAEQRRLEEQAARAAEEAQAEQRRRGEEAAKRMGGSLDENGQFIDPDLAGP